MKLIINRLFVLFTIVASLGVFISCKGSLLSVNQQSELLLTEVEQMVEDYGFQVERYIVATVYMNGATQSVLFVENEDLVNVTRITVSENRNRHRIVKLDPSILDISNLDLYFDNDNWEEIVAYFSSDCQSQISHQFPLGLLVKEGRSNVVDFDFSSSCLEQSRKEARFEFVSVLMQYFNFDYPNK